ncbi:MAG: hypothetical protein ACKPKO_21780, partial [Candidatus Fonsibacter sp.]
MNRASGIKTEEPLIYVKLCEAMAAPSATAMDAMTQMVLAGEGGLMAAMVAIENDAALAASLATSSVPTAGIPIVHAEGTGIRQDEGNLMEISLGETRQGEPSEEQTVLPPQPSKRPFESPLYRRG